MLKPVQFGCKCSAVVTVEMKSTIDRLEIRVKDGKVLDHAGTVEIQCKKCNTSVAVVSLAGKK